MSSVYDDQIHVGVEFVTDTPEVASLIFGMHNAQHLLEMFQPKPEHYVCLYCKQINHYDNLFCAQCGGPRGVILEKGI
jgi:hypothetical protein